MISLPRDLFCHILSFNDPIYELACQRGLPSADWAKVYNIVAPSAEYENIRGHIASLHNDRPYTVYRWGARVMVPSRASF